MCDGYAWSEVMRKEIKTVTFCGMDMTRGLHNWQFSLVKDPRDPAEDLRVDADLRK